jgi:transcriptional regulator with GAF, ATPase, and Fis domain
MNGKLRDFGRRYREGFEGYLREPDERALSRAYELGRSAIAHEFSILDLASAHQDVLLGLVRGRSASEEVIKAAGDFFLESMSAFEVARRALQAARETALVERHHATVLRRLSTFLTDASLALDASGSLDEMLQLVAEHARELTDAERCAVRMALDETTPAIDALAADEADPALAHQASELVALYHALKPPTGSLRMTGVDLDRHRAEQALTKPPGGAWRPRGWLAAPLTALDGRPLGLIQAFDKQHGDFSELDEAILTQLAQMASAAVERTQLYRQLGVPTATTVTAHEAHSVEAQPEH